MGRRGRRTSVQASIGLSVSGSQAVTQRLGQTQSLVAKTAAEVERFKKSGGIGSIAVGADRIRVAETQIARLGKELQQAEKEAKDLRRAMELASSQADFHVLQDELSTVEHRAAQARLELARIPRELRESVNESVGYLGDIDSALQQVAGTLTGLGGRVGGTVGGTVARVAGPLAGIAGGISIAGDIAGTAEQLPRLANALGTLRQRITSLDSGARGLIVNAGAAAATMVAFGLVLAAFEKFGKDASKAVTEWIEGLEEVPVTPLTELNFESLALTDGLETLIQQQQRYRDAIQKQKADADEAIRLFEQQGQAFRTVTRASDLIGFTDTIEALERTSEETGKQLRVVNNNLELLTSEYVQQEIALRRLVSGMQERISQDLELLNLQDSTSEGLSDRITELQRQGNVTEQVLKDTFNSIFGTLDRETQTALADFATRAAISLDDALDVQLFAEHILRTQELSAAQAEGLEAISNYVRELKNMEGQVNTLTDQVLPLIRAREREEDRLKSLEESTKAYEEALASLEDIQEQVQQAQANYHDFLRDRATSDARSALRSQQEQKLVNEIARAKELEALEKHQGQIVDARSQSADREAKIVQSVQDNIRKAIQKHHDDRVKAEQDFNKRLRRLDEDLQEDLLDAALANDAVRALSSERTAKKTAQRTEEDFNDAQAQRARDLERQLADQRQAGDKQLALQRQQAHERLNQLQEAGKTELSKSQQLEQQLAQLRDNFRKQDEQRRRRLEDQAHQQRIRDLQNQQNEISRTTNLAYKVQAKAAAFYAQALTGIAGQVNQAALTLTKGKGGGRIPRFAAGALDIRQPTFGIIGDVGPGMSEAIIPYNVAEGLDAALARASGSGTGRGGMNVSVNVPIHIGAVGELVTPGMLRQEIDKGSQDVVNAVVRGLALGRQQANAGAS